MKGKTKKPSLYLNNKIKKAALKMKLDLKEAKINSSDVFYNDFKDNYKVLHDKYNLKAVEMESFALYCNAAKFHKKALCILTVTDLFTDRSKKATAEERAHSLRQMIQVGIDTAEKFAD